MIIIEYVFSTSHTPTSYLMATIKYTDPDDYILGIPPCLGAIHLDRTVKGVLIKFSIQLPDDQVLGVEVLRIVRCPSCMIEGSWLFPNRQAFLFRVSLGWLEACLYFVAYINPAAIAVMWEEKKGGLILGVILHLAALPIRKAYIRVTIIGESILQLSLSTYANESKLRRSTISCSL